MIILSFICILTWKIYDRNKLGKIVKYSLWEAAGVASVSPLVVVLVVGVPKLNPPPAAVLAPPAAVLAAGVPDPKAKPPAANDIKGKI